MRERVFGRQRRHFMCVARLCPSKVFRRPVGSLDRAIVLFVQGDHRLVLDSELLNIGRAGRRMFLRGRTKGRMRVHTTIQ